MSAYYNEIDPFAAQWLRELIKKGMIADGEVDERSIEDVKPNELTGFTQCHFFAGIGVWSYALRQAGWRDDRKIWTGSCPCQPFSAAGKGAGFYDERHLWPHFHWLIEQCRPVTVIGEQVASKDGLAWFDLVQADLEGSGYASGAVDTCAAGFGAPHIRQRLYWLAHANSLGAQCKSGDSPKASGLSEEKRQPEHYPDVSERSSSDHHRCGDMRGDGLSSDVTRSIPTNDHWRDADWLFCRDGKWRPVEPGTSPLAYGSPARVGRLRGYGNAIVAPQAQAFIEAVMEVI